MEELNLGCGPSVHAVPALDPLVHAVPALLRRGSSRRPSSRPGGDDRLVPVSTSDQVRFTVGGLLLNGGICGGPVGGGWNSMLFLPKSAPAAEFEGRLWAVW